MRILGLIWLGCAVMAGEAEDRAGFVHALLRSPAIAAARDQVQAAEHARAAAGVLPDPMLTLDAGRTRPRQGEDMRMYGAMLEQPLPRWGERTAARLSADAQAAMSRAELSMIVAEHAAELARASAEADAARDTLALLAETRTRLEALATIERVQVSSGGSLGSALAVETRLRQLDLQQATVSQRRDDAVAMQRSRLGLAADAPLPPITGPDPAVLAMARTPEALQADAVRQEAEAMEHEARARGRPESAIGVAWEREAAGTDDETNAVSLSLRISLPVWRPAYAAQADAARLRARAAAHTAHAATWMAQNRIDRARRAAATAAAARATADDLTARIASEYQALLTKIGTGAAMAPMALELLDRISEARMAAIEAHASSRMATADLWLVAPPDLPAAEAP